MATLTLRLPDDLMHEVDVCAEEMYISRVAYVCKALEKMNAATHTQLRRARLMEASLKARSESMRVNTDFDAVEDAPHV